MIMKINFEQLPLKSAQEAMFSRKCNIVSHSALLYQLVSCSNNFSEIFENDF